MYTNIEFEFIIISIVFVIVVAVAATIAATHISADLCSNLQFIQFKNKKEREIKIEKCYACFTHFSDAYTVYMLWICFCILSMLLSAENDAKIPNQAQCEHTHPENFFLHENLCAHQSQNAIQVECGNDLFIGLWLFDYKCDGGGGGAADDDDYLIVYQIGWNCGLDFLCAHLFRFERFGCFAARALYPNCT